jgi:class 3 adenylate cyclase/predicted ATPase
MRCASCGFENPAGGKFCIGCGTPLGRPCARCGAENLPQARFCGQCGTALTEQAPDSPQFQVVQPDLVPSRSPERATPSAERRQLTVMFCDLVGSTALSEQLDPEELRVVIQAYQQACVEVITHLDGYVAKYLGDGLLVYFGYPVAHEDDAARAVRAGLGIVEAIEELPLPDLRFPYALQVRVGIHTGLVVAGEMGSGEYREARAIVGETPNIAARLQEKARPNSVVISPATYRLVTGLFDCQELGPQTLKGLSTPLAVYQVLAESNVRSRFEVAVRTGLTPLVGREQEVGLLVERWACAKQGEGEVVVLSGEPGIGKSRLVQVLKEQVVAEGAIQIEFRCSSYHQNSALYPVIEHLQRLLQLERRDSPQVKLEKLAQTLAHYHFPQADTLPLLAALLSLPHPEGSPPLTLSPQKQKEKTQEALVAWLGEEAERAAVYLAWEDLHWADPSSLELIGVLIDRVPTTRILTLLTYRPEFSPPWANRAPLTPLMLPRLPRTQGAVMVEKLTGGKALPPEVVQQIVAKTDGVPLFVEELTKMVLESGLVREQHGRYELTGPLPPLAIPTTLQDSLMARLDRLSTVREVAQLGATLGREFSYELIRAISPLTETSLQQALSQLAEAELLYQHGFPPQAHYLFKHALIQDAAYQSLLKSRRLQLHHQVAQILEDRFPETTETQPELLAHHYTAASLPVQALPYWQQAGQRANQRSAYVEAIHHLTTALEFLKTLPAIPVRAQQELVLQLTLGSALQATRGYAAPEVESCFARAHTLCGQMGVTPQLSPVLGGLWAFYVVRGAFQRARAMADQLLRLAQREHDPPLFLEAHLELGFTLLFVGEFVAAQEHLARAITLYNPERHGDHAFLYGLDPKVACLSYSASVLWFLGYPDRALRQTAEALALAQQLSHPSSLSLALHFAARLHLLCREFPAVQQWAEALISLSTERGLLLFGALGTLGRGEALTGQGQETEGIAQMRWGLAAYQATGAEAGRTSFLGALAEACEKTRQAEEGLNALAEALSVADKNGECFYEAELYRLKGTLTLQSQVQGPKSPVEQEAEECFLKAIEIARQQSAKSWELRAVTSLSRLWQQQGKKAEAHRMLAEIYGWFTEGFDTKDLQEAKALLESLG